MRLINSSGHTCLIKKISNTTYINDTTEKGETADSAEKIYNLVASTEDIEVIVLNEPIVLSDHHLEAALDFDKDVNDILDADQNLFSDKN